MTEQGVIITLARYRARQAVKQQLWDRGIKLSSVTARDVVEAAEVYIEQHPELLADAAETVRNNPQLRTLVERQARQARRILR